MLVGAGHVEMDCVIVIVFPGPKIVVVTGGWVTMLAGSVMVLGGRV